MEVAKMSSGMIHIHTTVAWHQCMHSTTVTTEDWSHCAYWTCVYNILRSWTRTDVASVGHRPHTGVGEGYSHCISSTTWYTVLFVHEVQSTVTLGQHWPCSTVFSPQRHLMNESPAWEKHVLATQCFFQSLSRACSYHTMLQSISIVLTQGPFCHDCRLLPCVLRDWLPRSRARLSPVPSLRLPSREVALLTVWTSGVSRTT